MRRKAAELEQLVALKARGKLDRVKVVVLEMSLLPLYAKAPSAEHLHRWLTEHGFICVGIHPEWTDPHTEELLQVNGVFSRIQQSV